MKSIILNNNNNYWKKTKFILAISIVVLLQLIEQVKTEGINIKVDMEDDNEKNVLSSTSISSMATTTTATTTETKNNNETQKAEMLMKNNSKQKVEDLRYNEYRRIESDDNIFYERKSIDEEIRYQIIWIIILIFIGCCYIFFGVIIYHAFN